MTTSDLAIVPSEDRGRDAPGTMSGRVPYAPRKDARYPGLPTVIHGNGAVAHVMGHVCGGVIGFPITPSTEISELYEAFRAEGGCNTGRPYTQPGGWVPN